MLLHCPGKRCNTTREHRLKVDTNEAICLECGEANLGASSFMKKAMKDGGDLYRTVEGKKAFMYKCQKCNVNRGVKLADDQAFCEVCNYPMKLAAPTIQAIKTAFKSPDDVKVNKGAVRKKSAQ